LTKVIIIIYHIIYFVNNILKYYPSKFQNQLHLTFGGKRRFFAPVRRNCEAVSRAQKNVAEQKRAEGEARTRFCGA